MPLIYATDSKGSYIKWGAAGKKYYYKPGDPKSRAAAREKAIKQARAIQQGGNKLTIRDCKRCGKQPQVRCKRNCIYQISCKKCNVYTAHYTLKNQAIRDWNARQRR